MGAVSIASFGRRSAVALLAVCSAACCARAGEAPPETPARKIAQPPEGKLYHGVYPGGKTGEEDDITPADLAAYEKQAGRKAAWVYFSHNWYHGRAFPMRTAAWIRDSGAAPYIRMMLRSSSEQDTKEADKTFSLEAIIAGKFDDDLKKWGAGAKEFGTPIIVEWGTEMNGDWFSWNGSWSGGDTTDEFGDPKKPDGPERFVAAYKHIVDVVRATGAKNITWVFHVNADDVPDEKWNRFENYYPGHDYADWVAVSVYGPKRPDDKESKSFREQMDACYPRLTAMAPDKPIIVAEMGCAAGHKKASADQWAGAALDDLLTRAPANSENKKPGEARWPKVIGFAWWNERWENGRRKADTTMRLQDTPALAKAVKDRLEKSKDEIVDRPAHK
jgi:hypothetical protein